MYAASYVWAKIIGYMERQLTDITVSAWLDDAEVVSFTEEALVVYSPSDFRQEVIRQRCAPYILDALAELKLDGVTLEVWGDEQLRRFRREKRADSAISYSPQFTFDRFVSGSGNGMAVKIARAVAHAPGDSVHNPLFIYGPPGVGKTHLLHAIANQVLQEHPEKRVACIRSDLFTTELIQAIQSHKTGEFKKKYRSVDVFLMDDIQFIAGKEATQEEFFCTFNDLYEHGKQIVLAADRRPADMVTLETRLRGRFGSGIMIGIEPPDYETRLGIVRSLAGEMGLGLCDEVADHIARVLTDNARQLTGALKKLRAYRDLSDMPLDLAHVQAALEDICSSSVPAVTPSAVLRQVCRYFNLDEKTLKGAARTKAVTLPRQIAIYLLRQLTNLSFPEIARLLCRDPATVQYAVRKLEGALAQKDAALEAALRDITSNIESSIF